MTNAELFKMTFGIYAGEFWCYTAERMQEWINTDVPDMNVGDTISRQAAIDAVEKESQVDGAYGYMDTKSIVDLLNDLPSAQPGRYMVTTAESMDLDILKGIINKPSDITLIPLPKAEPGWIPCGERLPKENGDYLVTGRHGAVNKRKYEDGRWYGNWAVIAWMPLPEPWKGEEDE